MREQLSGESDGDQAAEAALWRFAVSLYGRDGVAEACLALQDEHGVDIPLCLFLLWAGRRGGLTSDAAEAAAALSADWTARCVAPIRAVRRDLKRGAAEFARLEVATEPFRSDLKAIELAAERLQLRALARLSRRQGPDAPHLDAVDLFEAHRRRIGAGDGAAVLFRSLSAAAETMQQEEERDR